MTTHMTTKFPLGSCRATPGAIEAMRDVSPTHNSALPAAMLLRRHISGDWGDVDARDAQANEEALQTGARVLSAYKLRSGVKVWIITEADRSATTIMLPEDY